MKTNIRMARGTLTMCVAVSAPLSVMTVTPLTDSNMAAGDKFDIDCRELTTLMQGLTYPTFLLR